VLQREHAEKNHAEENPLKFRLTFYNACVALIIANEIVQTFSFLPHSFWTFREDMGRNSDNSLKKSSFREIIKNTNTKKVSPRRTVYMGGSKMIINIKRCLSGLSLKSERVSFSCDSSSQSLLAPRGLPLAFTLSFLVRCYIVIVFMTVLFLKQMSANFSPLKRLYIPFLYAYIVETYPF